MNTQPKPTRRMIIAGWILSGLTILMLLADSVGKLLKPEPVVRGTLALGYPASAITTLGIVLLLSTLLYAVPRFSVVGAILLTGYLGGAVATHVRVGHPLFSHVLFPVYVGIFIWAGLYLRSQAVRNVLTNNESIR